MGRRYHVTSWGGSPVPCRAQACSMLVGDAPQITANPAEHPDMQRQNKRCTAASAQGAHSISQQMGWHGRPQAAHEGPVVKLHRIT